MKNNKKTEQCFCKSYYDDNNVLRDCTCGKCGGKNWGERFDNEIIHLRPSSLQDSKTHHRIIKSFISSLLKQVFDEAVGEERTHSGFAKPELFEREDYGYNQKRQEIINLRKKYGV